MLEFLQAVLWLVARGLLYLAQTEQQCEILQLIRCIRPLSQWREVIHGRREHDRSSGVVTGEEKGEKKGTFHLFDVSWASGQGRAVSGHHPVRRVYAGSYDTNPDWRKHLESAGQCSAESAATDRSSVCAAGFPERDATGAEDHRDAE